MVKEDRLWPGGFHFFFDDTLFQPGTDSFLLGAFPRLHRGERVCDLGGGTGLLGLLLLAREPSVKITEVELQERSCVLCRRAAEKNGLAGSMNCIEADLRRLPMLRSGSFDLVITNPPYFTVGSGAESPDESRRAARSEANCTLDDVLCAAARLLRWGGRLCLVFRTERMAELMETARRRGLEPKRLRFVQNTADAAPSLFLLECRRGGHTGLQAEPPLVMYRPDGTPTAELDAVYFKDRG